MSDERIKDTADLIKRATRNPDTEDWMECFISLGVGRSSKRIIYYPDSKTFTVHNEMDDTYLEGVTLKDLKKKSNIIEALNKGALYEYGFSIKE